MTVAPDRFAAPRRRLARGAAAWIFALAAVGAAVLAARTGTGTGAFLSVDQLVAGPVGALAAVGGALPLGYAFAAGMIAAVNPCGLALLPAYLGLYLGTPEDRALGRAVAVAATVSGAFVLTFGAVGVLLTAVGAGLGRALPVVGLAVGVGLAAAGAHLLSGGRLHSSIGDRAAARLSRTAGAVGHRGYLAYGIAYAAASLGCALPIFLTVVGLATAAHDPARSAAQFVLYGLGMGAVVTALTIATALFKGAVVARARPIGDRLLAPASGALLVLTGAYVTAYWLALGF
ncbi:MAG TPA: cytochrome c biogenesis protein CcdA [Candidatus Dormibacteraeota bacterium]